MTFEKEDLETMHPSDIASKISQLGDKEKTLVFLKLRGEKKSSVFAYLNDSDQHQILKQLGSQEIADILNSMPPDDRTEMFENFPDELIKKIIRDLSAEERLVAVNLLGYPENSVGRIMTPH